MKACWGSVHPFNLPSIAIYSDCCCYYCHKQSHMHLYTVQFNTLNTNVMMLWQGNRGNLLTTHTTLNWWSIPAACVVNSLHTDHPTDWGNIDWLPIQMLTIKNATHVYNKQYSVMIINARLYKYWEYNIILTAKLSLLVEHNTVMIELHVRVV